MSDESPNIGLASFDQKTAKLLFWLLLPFAILGVAVLFLGGIGLFSPPRPPVWEGQDFGHAGDWVGPLIFPSFLVYLIVSLIDFGFLTALAFRFNDDLRLKPSFIWRSTVVFNLLATLYWLALTAYGCTSGGSGDFLPLLPIAVTIPVTVIATRACGRAP
jgi:hypothetical protein